MEEGAAGGEGRMGKDGRGKRKNGKESMDVKVEV